MSELENEALGVLDTFKELEVVHEEKGKALKKFQKEFDKIKSARNQLVRAEVDWMNQLEDIQRVVKENEGKQEDYTKKIEALKKKKEGFVW